MTPVACASCQTELASGSRFCPQCGSPVGAGETIEITPAPVVADAPPVEAPPAAQPPPVLHRVERRPLGVHPVPLLGGLCAITLALGVAFVAVGVPVPGFILLGAAVALFALFAGGVRRDPDAPVARLVLRLTDRTRSAARLAGVAVRAWLRAAVALLWLRGRRLRLRRELKANLAPLGEAVHRDDRRRARALKHKAVEIERELSETERQAAAARAAARSQIEREQATVQPTRAFSPIQER
jgi:hypothetical protein